MKTKKKISKPLWWKPSLASRLNFEFPSNREWMASEKLDGVRLAWDGKKSFWTRGNQRIQAPPTFRAALPRNVPLDGELFAGRGQFHTAQSMYSSPSNSTWKDLQYRVFDMPTSTKPYRNVYKNMHRLFPECSENTRVRPREPRACAVKQTPVHTNANARRMLNRLILKGAEGVMLRRADVPYTSGRTKYMLKMKRVQDAEAIVVRVVPGTGKYEQVMGSLEVHWVGRNREEATFKVGVGFTDRQRARAATLYRPGTIITVQYMELEASGKPRHPVFKGVRTNI
jgi:DNA ligase 1